MATPPRTYARGKTKSGFGASLLTAYGNRLLLTSALKPRGALGKAILIPFVRGLAHFFRWWSRGWFGQALGGKWAIAKMGPVRIIGFFGWIIKGLVELNYLLAIFPPHKAVKYWLKGLWIFIRNDRLG